ncbi:MAG: TonB-dependent receptor [Acidobacteria bacterium]|nr:TonB-dependent receptor [Acidobacteriota bacterium]
MFRLLQRQRKFSTVFIGFLSVIASGAMELSFAQLPTATLVGTVKDETAGVLPGVTITITNEETGLNRTALTDDSGSYRAPALPVGRYEVRAELSGFKSVIRHVTLSVGDAAVVDFVLPVGEVSERVEVTGEAPLINTTSSSLGGLVDDQKVADLPLNGRNFVDLAFLQPAVHEHRNMNLVSGMSGTWFTSNGAPLRSNAIMLDGANMVNLWGANSASITGSTLGVEGIREFRVVTNAFSAEYGMAMGSQISIVSKSGSNEFHGSLFEFHRNSALDARNFFDRKTASNPRRLPVFIRNNFGVSVGGPIVKDKTFFHGAYEGLRERLGVTRISNTIPNSARVDGGLVPTVNPIVKPLLTLFPEPNLPNNQMTFPFTQPTTEDYFQLRIDHTYSSNDSIFGRYTFDDAEQTKPRDYPRFVDQLASRAQYATISETHVFSPAVLNTVRLSYSRTFLAADSISGIRGPQFSLMPGQDIGNLVIGGVTPGLGLGPDPVNPTRVKQNVFTFSDDVFWTRGSHSVKFGTLINHYQQYMETNLVAKGFVIFPNLPAFLQGIPAAYQANTPGSLQIRTYHYNTYGFYIHDDWKTRSNFTLNLGLRYEFMTVPEEQQGRGAALRNIRTDKDMTLGKPFENPSLKNFSPRFGFAWDPTGTGKTAVRGAFALTYDVGNLGSGLLVVGIAQPPFSSRSQVAGPAARNFTLPLTFPPGSVGTAIRTIDFNVEQPHMLTYNLTIEQALPLDTRLSVAYAGSRGINLVQIPEGNPTVPQIRPDGRKFWTGLEPRRNPNWASITLLTAGGNSWYNSLQVGLEKRLSHGLQFQSSYTWSKLIDEPQGQLTNENTTVLSFGTDPDDRRVDRAVAAWDITHNWRFNTIYRLPSPASNGFAGGLLRGWWISGIVTVSTGYPFTPSLQTDRSRAFVLGGQLDLTRPNRVPGREADDIILGSPDRYFDPTAFTLQEFGFLGNAGRNILRGPGFANVDFSVAKDTPLPFLGEEGKLEFRAEFFNIFNRANFGPPDRRVFGGASPTTNEAPLPTAGRIFTTASTSRQIQLALKILF